MGEFLGAWDATVFDPWNKRGVRGLHEYGRESLETRALRDGWTFAPGPVGVAARAGISGRFWETL